ncbi:hypothetical protein PF005_g33444 [Phytophthora fragariae]|uniref:Uncharacterized protein n=1 Tax=Phytophthora fragariae TaxID=53985 RepID=A0A6A3DA20_9STRA|nr:hypothetical protein PF003_g38745 [Phytophthora fragariae]KAE8916447.1 hypothetical protein PF009_g33230 [Phytophthora fragariae]KAE9152911.1 hypothetical protein PF005_g33444 [Phytophthora fragariae]
MPSLVHSVMIYGNNAPTLSFLRNVTSRLIAALKVSHGLFVVA